MAHKLLKATKWISGNYGKQYANIAITYNNEQNKIFFLAQNGHIKFNVSDKIKENLKISKTGNSCEYGLPVFKFIKKNSNKWRKSIISFNVIVLSIGFAPSRN